MDIDRQREERDIYRQIKRREKFIQTDREKRGIDTGQISYRGTICGLTEKKPFLYRYFEVLGQKIRKQREDRDGYRQKERKRYTEKMEMKNASCYTNFVD